MSQVLPLLIRSADGQTATASVEVPTRPPWSITLLRDGSAKPYPADDLFDALVSLRLDLETSGSTAVCFGSRTDVYPSSMSRQMGGGRRAYRNRLGVPADPADLGDIFSPADPADVGTVGQQKAFHIRWVASIGAGPTPLSPPEPPPAGVAAAGPTPAYLRGPPPPLPPPAPPAAPVPVPNLPHPGEIEEAKRYPGGFVYRIAGPLSPASAVPPNAIVGCWKVDAQGRIVGPFIPNPKYDPTQWRL